MALNGKVIGSENKIPGCGILVLGLLLALSQLPAGATNSDELQHESQSQTGQETSQFDRNDSNGRQIAAIVPVIPVAHPVGPKLSTNHGLSTTATKPSTSTDPHWRTVSISVPTTVAEAADFCGSVASKAGQIAAEKVIQASAWLSVFIKQMTAPPTMTPAAPIYNNTKGANQPQLQQVKFNNKPWVMSDGRVKTLIQR